MDHGQEVTEFTRVNHDALLDALSEGTVVLTGNARLSRHLASEYGRRMLAQGREAWATPSVLPLDAWLLDTYGQVLLVSPAPLPRLLTPDQEQQVWAGIISREGAGLLRVDASASRARGAWKLVCDWLLDLDDPRFSDNETAEAFRRWARRFQAACARGGLAPESELPALLAASIARGECQVPRRILLAGFYDPTPAQSHLVSALERAGSRVRWVEVRNRPGRAQRLNAVDAREEIDLAADWARRILQADPDARIGIVVPDLAARRSTLAHRLRKVLDPESLRPGAPARPRPWNLSLGIPLSGVPVVRTALGLLSLIQPPIDTAALGALLVSPYWGLPKDPDGRRVELDRRALLDRRLRSIGDARMPLSSIRYEAARTDDSGRPCPWACPLLKDRLERLAGGYGALPGRAGTSDWAGAFANWLRLAGWPSGRPLDSGEFQAVDAWNGLLSRFSALGDFTEPMGRGEALAVLGRLAAETVFQPRAPEAPVQVLGIHEANSLRFDHLWVMGLHDAVWPPASGPDPFLPLAVQRERGLPHSTPEAEWAWSARVTSRLAESAADVVFSWPSRDGSEELACSPLIGHFPERPAEGLRALTNERWFARIRSSAGLEPVLDTSPIALQSPEVPGGSRVYSDQAACPFKAFGEHRLGARPLDRPGIGLGAMRSGTLMHRVLETLWRELGSQAGLLDLDAEQQAALVAEAVAAALEAQRRRSPVTLSPRYVSLEAARLRQRVMAWLELERRRSPFRVAEREQRQAFERRGVRVELRIDRVDELDDGSRVVLDYKTGQVRPAGWFGERPDDAQLPLYGVASSEGPGGAAPAAVAFAQIRADRSAFVGVVRDAGILPGLPSNRSRPLREAAANWPSVLEEWSGVIDRLAGDFSAGRAELDPKNGLNTCRDTHCELAPLCRVRERLSGSDDEEENAGGVSGFGSGTPAGGRGDD